MYETLTAYETPTCMILRRVRFFIPDLAYEIITFSEHWAAYVPKPSGMYETLTASDMNFQ